MLHENFETNFAFTSKKECGAFRLIRTSCKAYHQRGSDECGVALYFNSFLDSRHENPYLESYIGNRFFHLHGLTKIIFLNEDISNKLYLAEVRALRIADKIVTGPFWRIVENVDNMLEINPYLIQLKVSLSSLSVDALPIFRGEEVFSKS